MFLLWWPCRQTWKQSFLQCQKNCRVSSLRNLMSYWFQKILNLTSPLNQLAVGQVFPSPPSPPLSLGSLLPSSQTSKTHTQSSQTRSSWGGRQWVTVVPNLAKGSYGTSSPWSIMIHIWYNARSASWWSGGGPDPRDLSSTAFYQYLERHHPRLLSGEDCCCHLLGETATRGEELGSQKKASPSKGTAMGVSVIYLVIEMIALFRLSLAPWKPQPSVDCSMLLFFAPWYDSPHREPIIQECCFHSMTT